MNSQHKLYDYQVTPPAEAWTNIAAELEELQALRPLGQKLQVLETVPPVASWDHIFQHLEEEDSFSHLSERLQALEVAPPAIAWDKIDAELGTARPASKLAPVKKGSFNWSKYAVAACIVGLLGFSVFHLVEKSNRDSKNIIADLFEKKDDSSKSPVALQAPKTKPTIKPHTETGTDLALNEPVKPIQIKTASGNTYKTTVEKNKAIQGRYIMLMTEDGNVVRMSKKLGNMADCVAGENTSSDCNYQIEQWQKEMAKAPVAATPDNFLDILEMARSENSGL
ncbi:hypothetical protein [Niabella drilacis]|uniref:Uncharacterized protein n=1 Tax=Niabella drilacis (strain DSM 25811 / CCM 8410 / CCUG 62505 / LMG 26954 / E90) TaxID=1285928 RepID=A0A1G6I3A4_NIADE|nr:hypothetical protein [Niabella drilacis]SDC01017.1 hypothetical protein SAMN04487894_10179 [Niabella drilacis]